MKTVRGYKTWQKEQQSLLGKAAKLTRAVLRWIIAGRPERTKQEVAAILDEKCAKCDWFTKTEKGGKCSKCGCALRKKLKMKTEHCPLGLW